MKSSFPFGSASVDRQATSTTPQLVQSLFGEYFYNDIVYVSIRGGGFTTEDLALLEDLPDVRQLYISGNAIRPEGLVHLHGLQGLEGLSLGIPMTDESLRYLYTLKSLKFLFLTGESNVYRSQSKRHRLFDEDDYDSGVTVAGVRLLANEIPDCRISY